MNLKLISQVLPQTVLAFGLGLIVNPYSAQAVNSELATDNVELSRPTLLVNKAEQVSMLLENSQNLSVDVPTAVSITENTANTTYTIDKNERVTNFLHEANENRASVKNNTKEIKVQSVQTPTLVAQNVTANNTSLSIPVELPPSSTPNNQFISIPVEVENPVTPQPSAVNIPVNVASSSSQTENPYDRSSNITQEPTLISNTGNFDRSYQPQNQRIINSAPSQRLENRENTTSPNLVSSIPIQIESYNPMIAPSAGQMVSPDLPQINSPEPYLPEGNRPFNGYIWPAKGVFTSGYGWRWGRMHKGIDIAAPVGTPILAAADGEVISSGWNSGGFGNLVRIRHFDGTITLYAHNSRIHVRRGDFVKQGQHIANMGSTGFSTGPHLHFEIHPNGSGAVNPIALLPKR